MNKEELLEKIRAYEPDNCWEEAFMMELKQGDFNVTDENEINALIRQVAEDEAEDTRQNVVGTLRGIWREIKGGKI